MTTEHWLHFPLARVHAHEQAPLLSDLREVELQHSSLVGG